MELSAKEKYRSEYRALIEKFKNMDLTSGLLSADPDALDAEDAEPAGKSRGEDWSEA